MILHVGFDQFGATVRRLLETKEVYIRAQGGAVAVSASHPNRCYVVGSLIREPLETVRAKLSADGFEVFDGEWTDAGESPSDRLGERQTYLAAVAYTSREKMPGLWVDAYPAPPAPAIVLKTFYDELSANGEIGEVNFEEFVRLANPNVVIVGPNEIQGFLNEKEAC